MTEEYYNITFEHNGTRYTGRVSPDHFDEKGRPRSFHIVLNEVFYGYMNKENGYWHVNEERPDDLTKLVGQEIDALKLEYT